jgi:hypothetical protein
MDKRKLRQLRDDAAWMRRRVNAILGTEMVSESEYDDATVVPADPQERLVHIHNIATLRDISSHLGRVTVALDSLREDN